GSPFFDKWFTPPAGGHSREDFCRMVGLQADRPILLYLGSSKHIATDESWFVEDVDALIKASADPRVGRFQLLVRPHPAHARVHARLADAGIAVWPRGGALPDTEGDLADMRSTFAHADAAIG